MQSSKKEKQPLSKKKKKNATQKVSGTQVLASGKLGTGLDTDVDMEDDSLPKICRTTVEKFVDKCEGTEKEMKSIFMVWNTTTVLDYKNLERKINQTARKSLKKEPLNTFCLVYNDDPQKQVG